ncbi:MAG: hypothetical protein ABW131_05260 [Candidatus Sedimenticola sp. 6PFRAG5]
MKKILGLMLLIPLTTIAAEHGGKAMETKKAAPQATEHAGKGMEMNEQLADEASNPDVPSLLPEASENAGKAAEHGGKPMEEKASEHADTAAEHGGKPMKKKVSEHAGMPVE